jgi:hypothetical protein
VPVDDLERRYRAVRDPVARSQWQLVWQLAAGRRIAEVEELTGYSDRWMRKIAACYNALGPAGIGTGATTPRRDALRGISPVLHVVLACTAAAALT